MNKDKINRINELARKKEDVGLSDSEKEEQAHLRKEYVKAYRESLKASLHSMKFVDENGKDVTPQKLKDEKNKNKR